MDDERMSNLIDLVTRVANGHAREYNVPVDDRPDLNGIALLEMLEALRSPDLPLDNAEAERYTLNRVRNRLRSSIRAGRMRRKREGLSLNDES